ncbi:hypothetical protein L798_00118, partial [Zootermopsis nevadensis]
HFGEHADSSGKDNEIVIQKRDDWQFTAHLGFLQVGHRYEIYFTLPRSLCKLDETTELRESVCQKVPNVNCKLVTISSDKKDIMLKLELFAYKEKLLKEELCLQCSDHNSMLTLVVLARVLGRGKGTPLLKNGIKCIRVELDDESEASDWQGFD